ncbi:hypothetical protein V6N12_007476 [Hibiscus sabdariffa]|uniref:Knl1 C-terminal RWD domain-containing protein n=1 Tax=Hibiscus sabdariffa TaxID=183260 RepID=A0ABR2F1W6_9ROSI
MGFLQFSFTVLLDPKIWRIVSFSLLEIRDGDNKISEVWIGTGVLNSESIAVTNGTPVNQSGKDVQLDLVKHFENGNPLPTKDGLKENSPQDKIQSHNVDHGKYKSTSLAAVKIVDERGSNGFDLQNTFSTLKLQPGGPEKNIQTTVERTCSIENIIEEQMKVSSVYASLGPHASKLKRSLQKTIWFRLTAVQMYRGLMIFMEDLIQVLSKTFRALQKEKGQVEIIKTDTSFPLTLTKLHHHIADAALICGCHQAYNQSGDILHKRVAETRQVLYRIVYGKAKLQLMHVKRERLLKQVELLRTGVQESQMLKLNFVKHHFVSSEKDAKLSDNSCSVTFGNNLEGASCKVSTMKNEVEALENKIKNLTKSFHTCCKIRGEQSSSGTIELVNDHLKKRTCCRLIRQGIQLWEVDDLQNRNGHHNVVLNYHGFISQSLVLNPGRNSSIFVANKLNDMNISKDSTIVDDVGRMSEESGSDDD